MRVTSKGQVTIHIRQRFGLLSDTEVDFVVDEGEVRIVRAAPHDRDRGARAVGLLRGSPSARMTTDELMELTRGSA